MRIQQPTFFELDGSRGQQLMRRGEKEKARSSLPGITFNQTDTNLIEASLGTSVMIPIGLII